MLTVPVFRPWRPIWDACLGPATRRLDELAGERQRGRTSPPRVTPELIRGVASERVQSFLHSGTVRPPEEVFAVLRQMRPLIKAAVWPRWLLLEATLEEATSSGALHLAALALRTQIEELDALQDVAPLLTLEPRATGDAQLLSNAIEVLTRRLLPRVRTKSADELLAPAGEAPGAARRTKRLQEAFDALGDYVHPNYGSHVLTVRPHSVEAARILVDTFVAVYDTFLSFPWAREASDRPRATAVRDERSPFLVLAEDTAPRLARAFGTEIDVAPWPDAVTSFRHQVEVEDSQNAQAEAIATTETPAEGLELDVGAIRTLRERGGAQNSLPVPISTSGERLRYALLVGNERRLVAEAEQLGGVPGERHDETWLRLLCSGLTFSINVTEAKLDILARQAARLINSENVLGAALAVRSMLEHHAVAVELGKKLRGLWERIERAAPNDERVSAGLGDAEKQIARVLGASPASREHAAAWRRLWEGSVRRYHVLDPIKAMDADQPGYLKTYGLLSHIVHGTVCTGGDLLGEGGVRPARHTLAQLALFLAELSRIESLLDRQAGSMIVAHRLDAVGRASAASLGARIGRMRLQGQKLKVGRDMSGCGTREDPFRFRRGLLYHDSYYHWLTQEGVKVRSRRVDRFAGGIGDIVETEDGRTLYFLNNDAE